VKARRNAWYAANRAPAAVGRAGVWQGGGGVVGSGKVVAGSRGNAKDPNTSGEERTVLREGYMRRHRHGWLTGGGEWQKRQTGMAQSSQRKAE